MILVATCDAAAVQGPRRAMEDRHVLIEHDHAVFGGVYDGHGGAEVADLLATHLHMSFFDAMDTGVPPEAALEQAFGEADHATNDLESGSVAGACYLNAGRLVFAHVGDVKIVLVRTSDVIELTRDHSLNDPAERARILAHGGQLRGPYVTYGGEGLMVTRAFGDRRWRTLGIVATPDIDSRVLEEEAVCVVLASDGLWEVLDVASVGDIARRCSKADALVRDLVETALSAGTGDNVSVLAVYLQNQHGAAR